MEVLLPSTRLASMNSFIDIDLLTALHGHGLISVILLLLGAISCHLAWTRYHGGLHRVPGPFLASISSLWKFHVTWQEDMAMRSVLLHEIYGPIVRIGPNHVSASSPEALRIIHVENRGFPKVKISILSDSCVFCVVC